PVERPQTARRPAAGTAQAELLAPARDRPARPASTPRSNWPARPPFAPARAAAPRVGRPRSRRARRGRRDRPRECETRGPGWYTQYEYPARAAARPPRSP